MRTPALLSAAVLFALSAQWQAIGQELLYQQDFSSPNLILEEFTFTDPEVWRVGEGRGRWSGSLTFEDGSVYEPPHRSPTAIALIEPLEFQSFTLDVYLTQTGREYGHRDLCIFLGFQDPAHFYYVHLASQADDHAHNIFIVNDAPRTKIATSTTDGVQWDDDEGRTQSHHVRVVRDVPLGAVMVFFDDMTEPIMTAEDKTFAWGRIGFGSFDDSGIIRNISITGTDVRTPPQASGFRPSGQPLGFRVQELAHRNAEQSREAWARCDSYLQAWMDEVDPESGLLPRNLGRDRHIWSPQDSAADNWPFMVLTASFTDQRLFGGHMQELLAHEQQITSRLGALPDAWNFDEDNFLYEEPDLDRIIFGASEYIKDGLLPITEWLGPSPWSQRMFNMLDELWARAPFHTPFGFIPSDSHEINGEMLQVLSRVFWMTDDDRYLEWAIRIGDWYLRRSNHPTRHERELRLRDHGCEIVSGLVELYATCSAARPKVAMSYREGIHEMLDTILEVGRNGQGFFYNSIDPINGRPIDGGVADTWGYTANALLTVAKLDDVPRYRAAVRTMLYNLSWYRSFQWEGESADGYADSIEGAINLNNREAIPEVEDWIDSEMQVMWSKQRPGGLIEGWHGDGNFARTTMMYALMKSQGMWVEPWRGDVRIGAVEYLGLVYLMVMADEAWEGVIRFDNQRHREVLHMREDWPRINQFPEWLTINPDRSYLIHDGMEWENIVADRDAFEADRGGVPGRELLRNGLRVRFERAGILSFLIRAVE